MPGALLLRALGAKSWREIGLVPPYGQFKKLFGVFAFGFFSLAVIAGMWARRSDNLRGALVILGAVVVFAGASFGINLSHESGLKAPASITVDGKPFSLQQGNTFLFFYDPTCTHCEAAARKMAKLNWKDSTVVAVPIDTPLIRMAREKGLPVITGVEMFVHQGARQFEIWTGKPAPEEEMLRVVVHALRQESARQEPIKS